MEKSDTSTSVTVKPEGCFPFMSLPLEIRRKIYREMLVTSCCQPGIHNYGSDHLSAIECYPLTDETPSAQILLVSRIVYDEAHSILYTNNTFTIACTPDMKWHACDCFDPKNLAQDVSKILAADDSSLPRWLFAGRYRYELDGENGFIETELPHININYDHGLGYQFPAFLRQIGQLNTALIRSVQLSFTDLLRSANDFPVYAEILQQHVPRLRMLVIDFDWLDDYGSDCGWDESESGRNGFETGARDDSTDRAVFTLFGLIRSFCEVMPEFMDLGFVGCPSSFDELGEAIMEEKRRGTVFDLKKVWHDVTPFRGAFGGGYGHPFPHPKFTSKDKGPEAFEKFKVRLDEIMRRSREERGYTQLQQSDQLPA